MRLRKQDECLHYIDKKEFDEIFLLSGVTDNNIVRMSIYEEDFYFVEFSMKICDRFIKIQKIAPNKKIDLYLKIIEYTVTHSIHLHDVMERVGAKELAGIIDKQILTELFKLSDDIKIIKND